MKVATSLAFVGAATAQLFGGGSTRGGSSGSSSGGVRGNTVSNELESGSCKAITFIMARASTEPGNMGGSMGPLVCAGLKKEYNNDVACQGVGDPYTASLMDNTRPKGTTDEAIAKATSYFKLADSKCPDSIIVFGGYSQGTAVMHNAVSNLPKALKDKLAGGVMFGDTRNKQDNGQIPNFPKDKVVIYCDPEDGVCGGKLSVNAGHFVYPTNGDEERSIAFLVKQIEKAKKAKPAEAAPAAAAPAAAAPAASSATEETLTTQEGCVCTCPIKPFQPLRL